MCIKQVLTVLCALGWAKPRKDKAAQLCRGDWGTRLSPAWSTHGGVSTHVLKTHCKRALSLLTTSGSSFRAKCCSKCRGLLVSSHVPYQGTQPVRLSHTQCWELFHLHLRAQLSGFCRACPWAGCPPLPQQSPVRHCPDPREINISFRLHFFHEYLHYSICIFIIYLNHQIKSDWGLKSPGASLKPGHEAQELA